MPEIGIIRISTFGNMAIVSKNMFRPDNEQVFGLTARGKPDR